MKTNHWIIGSVLCAALAACGGGGGKPGASLYGGGTAASGATAASGSGTVSNATGTLVVSMGNRVISASTPGTVTALFKDAAGQAVPNAMVTFAIENGTATVAPARVMTDEFGYASTMITPKSDASGADAITVSATPATNGAAPLSAKAFFTASAVSAQLGAVLASPTTVPAYGASVINLSVAGASTSTPVTLSVASTCAAQGKAVISPSTVTLTSPTATVTYQDKGCAANDLVNVSMNGTSQAQSLSLAIVAPQEQSLEFVSSSPEEICIAGSGCAATSIVSFKLRDQFGLPVRGKDITFALDVANLAQLSFPSAKTDSSGVAQVSVSAKNVPGPVRVRANTQTTSGTTLGTVSNTLAINAALPTQRSVSLSQSIFNMEGMNYDGEKSKQIIRLSDRFSNPVKDGTSVSFVAEGGSVVPATCTTLSGTCEVNFVSSNYRPADGRITVLAYAQGEESFNDQDGDNMYTLAAEGNNFTDLGNLYVDKNENGLQDTGELLLANPANAAWDAQTLVRASHVIVLSETSRFPRLFELDAQGGCTTTVPLGDIILNPTPANCRVAAGFCVRDGNTAADVLGGNPLPQGTTVTAQTTAELVTVAVDNSPFPNTTGPTRHIVTATLDDCTKGVSPAGALDVTIATPKGIKFTINLGTVQ